MARVKIEGIMDHLASQIRKALRDTIDEVAPAAKIDEYELFRTFKRAVRRKCSTWERIPDKYVEAE